MDQQRTDRLKLTILDHTTTTTTTKTVTIPPPIYILPIVHIQDSLHPVERTVEEVDVGLSLQAKPRRSCVYEWCAIHTHSASAQTHQDTRHAARSP